MTGVFLLPNGIDQLVSKDDLSKDAKVPECETK